MDGYFYQNHLIMDASHQIPPRSPKNGHICSVRNFCLGGKEAETMLSKGQVDLCCVEVLEPSFCVSINDSYTCSTGEIIALGFHPNGCVSKPSDNGCLTSDFLYTQKMAIYLLW